MRLAKPHWHAAGRAPHGVTRGYTPVARSLHVVVGLGGLFVITDAAAQFADLGYKAYLRKRRRSGAWLWNHVARHLSDLTFRLLRRGVDRFTIGVAASVF